MDEQSQDSSELRDLAAQHSQLEGRLKELIAKAYLSEPEQLEEVNLKKRKLQLKDRMEDILRHRSDGSASASHDVQAHR